MKNLNKVLAMVVVFMMMLSTVAFASSFTDVADTSSYSTAIEVGVDLGIIKGYTDGTFAPEGEITRAEFAAIIVRLLGQEAQAEGAKASTQFVDVPADHWAAGYINIATQVQVINGYGDGNFGPDDLVEYQDAITMMVRALGYEPAIGSAGYPTGYLTKAGELGLTSNVKGSNGVAINRGTVAQIAFNALDVPLMTQSGYGTFTQYVVNDGYSSTTGTNNVKKTLLSENYSTVKVQGVITTSSEATTTSATAAKTVTVNVTDGLRNKFDIAGSEKMYIGDSDAAAYVGKKAVLFVEYDEFEDECTIVSLYEITSKDSVVIDMADVDSFTMGTPAVGTTPAVYGTIKYDVEGSKSSKTSTFAVDADIYYNGVKEDSVSSFNVNNPVSVANMLGKSGSIELANLKDSDADYDTIYITSYDVIVIKEVKASAERVVSKAASDSRLKTISFNEDDGDVKATLVDAKGADLDWTSLEENDVVVMKYVLTTANKSIYEAEVVENTVTGTVTEVDETANWGTNSATSSDYKYVSIDGTEYKVLSIAENDKEIKVGDEGTYYLTDSGIVWHEASVSVNNNYGYVITAQNEDTANMKDAKVKMLTADGIITYDVNSKIYVTAMNINGNGKYEKSSNKLAVDGSTYSLASVVNTLITFKTDASGAVTAIELPLDADSYTSYDAEDYFTAHNSVVNLNGFDPDDNTFGRYSVDENTVIFDASNANSSDWEVVALNNLAEDDYLRGIKVYNVDDEDYIGAIVINSSSVCSISGSMDVATFVTGTSQGYDEDGVLVDYVKGYVNGEAVVYTSDNVTLPTVGSLVIPSYKANGDVKAYNVVANGNFIAGNTTVKGYVADTDNNTITQDSTKGRIVIDGTTYKIPASANVYVYDSTTSARVNYETNSYIGRVEYDEDNNVWVLDDDFKTSKDVKITIYEYDGDIVDVVYYVY